MYLCTYKTDASCAAFDNALYNDNFSRATMSLITNGGRGRVMVEEPGRSSPDHRLSRPVAGEDFTKADKGVRRYAALIERALASWEVRPQEWADYIAFLSRLLKALQTTPQHNTILPHSASVAFKLAQCLNPALPSGVHQKALDVYTYIFSTFGTPFVADHLQEFLPGLSSVLAFASLSVRPALFALFEEHILGNPASDLRPALRSLILSLLPALEEETSDDFDRAFEILESLEHQFASQTGFSDNRGFFWQCLFLSIISSSTRRQGGLNYMIRKLPRFGHNQAESADSAEAETNARIAESVISPEPGLLIRCFVSGLNDPQLLIHRGFLDLLVSHVPLSCTVVQRKVGQPDMDRLVSAASRILLRRDMSLNRRLWSWFLGPGSKASSGDISVGSASDDHNNVDKVRANKNFEYFATYGRASLQRSMLQMFEKPQSKASERARPFRICLSLMDRGEIGGVMVPSIFLPAIRSVYDYSRNASHDDTSEVLRSASLFFDGIEAQLIWNNLVHLLSSATHDNDDTTENLQLFLWVVQNFNLKDEEMQVIHIPYACLYILSILSASDEYPLKPANIQLLLTILAVLLNETPQRAFLSATSSLETINPGGEHSAVPSHVKESIMRFYGSMSQTAEEGLPFSKQAVFYIFQNLLTSLIAGALLKNSPEVLPPAATALFLLSAKELMFSKNSWTELRIAIGKTVRSAELERSLLEFTTLNSIVNIFVTMLSQKQIPFPEGSSRLEQDLIYQIWQYLSPSRPKYHVEAVRLLWQFADLVATDDSYDFYITALLNADPLSTPTTTNESRDGVRHFAVLWAHTMPVATSKDRPGSSSLPRRGSAMSTLADSKQSQRRERVLAPALMVILDALDDTSNSSYDAARSWCRGQPSFERIFRLHFEQLLRVETIAQSSAQDSPAVAKRKASDLVRECRYFLGHFLNLLRIGNEAAMRDLDDLRLSSESAPMRSGATVLAETCLRLLCSDSLSSFDLSRTIIEILLLLLESSISDSLRNLNIESDLLEHLISSLTQGRALPCQDLWLKLLGLAMKVRLQNDTRQQDPGSRRTPSLSISRSTTTPGWPSPNASSTVLPLNPFPPQLLNCLRLGFSARVARAHMDHWLSFLSSALQLYQSGISSSLIPLVESLCRELDKSHESLLALSITGGANVETASETEAMALLEAIEMLLSHAHESMLKETNVDSVAKVPTTSQGLLSNVASGVFRTEAPAQRNSQSNSRLTVILAFQDAIRSAARIWIWASHAADVSGFDKYSAGTTSFNALRLRNRTRHMLEQIFAAEPLESLEVVIYHWCFQVDATSASAAIDLLHVMQGCRPKNVIPAVLDALCSRTNSVILPAQRLSSQTMDLSSLDVVLFLSAYISSVEDDAVDEVWSDCINFWREVLGNPLPYRQVLPALLSTILLVAQKVDNTNFGEQRKMRRELGDIFQRLLAATFTTMPAGYITDTTEGLNTAHLHSETNSIRGNREMRLVTVLVRVMANIEIILETAERIAVAINSISSHLIGPLFHSKAFPRSVTPDSLSLLLLLTQKAPNAKSWKKDLNDAFNDPRLLSVPSLLMQEHWFPILHQWCVNDKERLPELVSRLAPPSTAGIMFGVGANTARIEADRKTQLNIRRISLLLLASPQDYHASQQRSLLEKLVELLEATPSSSPSAAVKSELFMLCQAMVLTMSAVQLSGLWPIINQSLQTALGSILPGAAESLSHNNLSLLQACRLLDLLVVIAPDDFQLQEWLFVCDTIDAVYRSSEWIPSALADQVSEVLTTEATDNDVVSAQPGQTVANTTSERRRLLLPEFAASEREDWKAMARDDFAVAILRPFLSQLSIHCYEGVYSMDHPDILQCRRVLLQDLLDLYTIVE